MQPLIVDAIAQRRRLGFTYHGKPRIVEPQCYGVGSRGTDLLRAHQIVGGTQREPLFTVSEIEGLTMLEVAFDRPGPNYKRGDSAMRVIFAQL